MSVVIWKEGEINVYYHFGKRPKTEVERSEIPKTK